MRDAGSSGSTPADLCSPRRTAGLGLGPVSAQEARSAPVDVGCRADRLASNKYKAPYGLLRALEESKASLDVTPHNSFVLETALQNAGEVVAQAAPQPIRQQNSNEQSPTKLRHLHRESSLLKQSTKSLTNHNTHGEARAPVPSHSRPADWPAEPVCSAKRRNTRHR